MVDIAPIEIDPDTADMLRSAQDVADAVAYAFAVPSMCVKPISTPLITGIDWAKGYGPTCTAKEPITIESEEPK